MSDASPTRKSLNDQLDEHSAEGIAILSAEPSRITRGVIWLLFGLLLSFAAWSFVGRADVIVTAGGSLGPEENERHIFAPVGGELIELYIAEGTPVAEGDVIARVNALGAIELANRAATAELQLRSAENNVRLFDMREKAMNFEIKNIEQQIVATRELYDKLSSESFAKLAEDQRLKLGKARANVAKAKNELDFAAADLAKHERLFKSPGGGGISRSTVEKKRAEHDGKAAAHQLARNELGALEVSLIEAGAKKKTEIYAARNQLLGMEIQVEQKRVERVERRNAVEVALQGASMKAASEARISFSDLDEDNFLLIRAPVAGVVTQLGYPHSGAQVDPKRPFAGIAPADDEPVLHVEIAESDRALLREGMTVRLKFRAFPFQRHGFVNGTLQYIAPSATQSQRSSQQQRILIYRAKVSLGRNHFVVEGQQIPLRYGMTADAEIVVRKRRLIDIALDPFRRAAG